MTIIYHLAADRLKHKHICRKCKNQWTCAGNRAYCGLPDIDMCPGCVSGLDKAEYRAYILETILVNFAGKPLPEQTKKPITAEDFFNV